MSDIGKQVQGVKYFNALEEVSPVWWKYQFLWFCHFSFSDENSVPVWNENTAVMRNKHGNKIAVCYVGDTQMQIALLHTFVVSVLHRLLNYLLPMAFLFFWTKYILTMIFLSPMRELLWGNHWCFTFLNCCHACLCEYT